MEVLTLKIDAVAGEDDYRAKSEIDLRTSVKTPAPGSSVARSAATGVREL